MKSVKMFGKSVPLMAILVMVLCVGGAYAALIPYYGKIIGTSQVEQSLLIDDKSSVISEDFGSVVAGTTVNRLHFLRNRADVRATVVFDTTYIPGLVGTEIVTRYDTEITDDVSLKPAFFGKSSYELVTIKPETTYTLNDLFAGNGLQYSYKVLNGGTYNGASPIVAIIDLYDGRHVVLFPGWGARTGDKSLQFGDTVATSTADTGTVPVDFVVYGTDFVKIWNNQGSYPAWTATKALAGCPVTGTEVVVSVAIAHQSGGSGESDKLESLAYGSETYKFAQIYEDSTYTLEPGQKIYFVARYIFSVNIAPRQYQIYTQVSP